MKSLTVILALIFATSIGMAASLPSYVKGERSYWPMRSKLVKSGWQAHGVNLRREGQCSDSLCAKYPEAVDCSGTGLGYCTMAWQHKDGTIVVILTTGEENLIAVRAGIER